MATRTASPNTDNADASQKEPRALAAAAGLAYVNDRQPGIRRRGRPGKGAGFRYVAPDGAPLTDRETLDRIAALAIPPAWRNVWIAPDQRGHIQATGRDARGRKQYRYHDRWNEARAMAKYGRMRDFGLALPAIRRRVERDLALPGLPREKVLAVVVRLLDTALIRIGNAEYAAANDSYGLTTMKNRHVVVRGDRLRFRFKGKSGVRHTVDVNDRTLARIVRRCRELPGELFAYLDDSGAQRDVTAADINGYLRAIDGRGWTAKDFRTWGGTVLAAATLRDQPPAKARRRAIAAAVREVAERLGNTPAVCRASYVHPAVFEAYGDGTLAERMAGGRRIAGLRAEEQALINLLDSLAAPRRARARGSSAD